MFDRIRKQIKVSNLPLLKLAIGYSLILALGVAAGLLLGWAFPVAAFGLMVLKNTIKFWYTRLLLKLECTESLYKLGPEDFASATGVVQDPKDAENAVPVYRLVQEILENNKDVFKGMYLADPSQPHNGGITLYFSEDAEVNAFTTGPASSAALVIQQGEFTILDKITDPEKRKAALSATIIHELGHILYRHTWLGFMTDILFDVCILADRPKGYQATPKNLFLISLLGYILFPLDFVMSMVSRQQEFQADSLTARCVYERSKEQKKRYPHKLERKTYHTANKNSLVLGTHGSEWTKNFKGLPDWKMITSVSGLKKLVVDSVKDWKNGVSYETLKIVSRIKYPLSRWYFSMDSTHPFVRTRMEFIKALQAEQQPEYENKGWLERGRDVLLFELNAWLAPLQSDDDLCQKYDKLTRKPLVVIGN